ncbi:hypothetical protein ABZ890_12125 [Streptomyces sp. NPDC046984]|uniref:hypothetical protein n=1 Tax=Streptomyces sp. NPDC046984 TaxID=3155138 RepID=UPI0033DB5154
MTSTIWLIAPCLFVLAVWVVLAVLDTRNSKRPLPRVAQPAWPTPPNPLPTHLNIDMASARAARGSYGRHRRTEEF